MASPTVRAIDSRSVHQICSGQVVVTLSTAMKELVENSLDAGATNIEIRLKNYGADCIEVIDNGSGVLPENFAALALKHHTSKLNVFSDLVGVETFGFRGEALSSLCALSNLSVTTCHQSQSIGTRLEYDHDGRITKQTAAARVQGTTVTLQNLFYTLPVRHKEFLRNIKREYSKLIQVLQSYCIISTGVRINCFTQSEKGKKTLVLSTNGNTDIRENISNVFGPKQLQTVLEFKQISPETEDCEEQGLDISNINENPVFKLTGYVSCCDHGSGRSTTERQFLFINKRPCDLPKVVRVVNEVYHVNNRNQYPFLVLDISLDKELVDVNVTPDKRHIFLQQEKLLLATIKSSLKAMFDPGSTVYNLNEKPFTQIKLGFSKSRDEMEKSTFSQSIKDRLLQANSVKQSDPKKGYNSIMKFAKKFAIGKANNESLLVNGDDTSASVAQVETNNDPQSNKTDRLKDEVERLDCGPSGNESDISNVTNCNDIKNLVDCNKSVNEPNSESLFNEENNMKKGFGKGQGRNSDYNGHGCTSENTAENFENGSENVRTLKRKFENSVEDLTVQSDSNASCKRIRIEETGKGGTHGKQKSITVSFDWKELRTKNEINYKDAEEANSVSARIFRAPITPEDNQNAEEELRRHITKDMFNQMEIVGQFNQGFIISKLKNDLFIIDQHASDEKYNFEEQQKNTVLKSQRLIKPQVLDLTAVNEGILIDNVEIFHKNGFDFEIDEEAPVSKKVKLVSLPVSRNWSFGKSDIDELVFMLSDNSGMMYRPSSVRKMFAMRACRMSVMVGRALDKSQMRRILSHMGEMDHPWNCPHGRPTMRHLINLNMVRK